MLLPRELAIYLPREQSVFGMNCMVQWKSSLQVNTLLLLALEVETNNPLDALKLLLKTQCTSHCLMATISYTDFPGDHPQNRGVSQGVLYVLQSAPLFHCAPRSGALHLLQVHLLTSFLLPLCSHKLYHTQNFPGFGVRMWPSLISHTDSYFFCLFLDLFSQMTGWWHLPLSRSHRLC